MWRIVGVNPDGTIKLILETPSTISKYSENYKYADYTGFTYEYANQDTNNDIMNYLEEWYKNNIDSKTDSYIEKTTFCNDTSGKTSGKYSNNKTVFGAYDRIIGDINPTATCPSTKNDFGGIYTQKVGLITADEVALAGGVHDVNNYNYYLYNGTSFFTASPSQHIGNVAYMVVVTNTGSISEDRTDSEQGIRPVINIVGSVTFEGSGTKDNPYIIDLD